LPHYSKNREEGTLNWAIRFCEEKTGDSGYLCCRLVFGKGLYLNEKNKTDNLNGDSYLRIRGQQWDDRGQRHCRLPKEIDRGCLSGLLQRLDWHPFRPGHPQNRRPRAFRLSMAHLFA